MNLVTPSISDIFEPNIEIGKFPDGDSHIHIPALNELGGQGVTLFHRLYPDQNERLVELLLILETLQAEKVKTTVVVPYLPYARQDKKKLDGEVPSGLMICRLLKAAGCEKLVTFDCHFLNKIGDQEFQGLPILNLSMNKELVEHAKQKFGGEEFEVTGPDSGSAYLVAGWGGNVMKKKRKDYEKNKISYREIEDLVCDIEVKDKNVLILDDMISTGSTMIKAAEKMLACGAKSVCCAATHGLFLYNALPKLRKVTDCIFSSDSVLSDQAEVGIKPRLVALQEMNPKLF